MYSTRLVIILAYKLTSTNDKLTSRAGLLVIAQLMKSIQLAETIDQHFAQPKSNRGFKPSLFLQTLILMHHEGSFHLDDVRHLSNDDALKTVLDIKCIPQACTLGNFLRKMGNSDDILKSWTLVNQTILKPTLHNCKGITLDIDATEVIANKFDAQWTYNKNKGYMPMVGHITETGQIVPVMLEKVILHHQKKIFNLFSRVKTPYPITAS